MAFTLSEGDLIVTEAVSLVSSDTLAYVPERRLPTTGRSLIWMSMLDGGRLFRLIWAAADVANAGRVGAALMSTASPAAAACRDYLGSIQAQQTLGKLAVLLKV